jgi:4-hydroxy-2-oxoheptanedioate aldolase
MRFDLIQQFRDRIAQKPVLGPFSKTVDPAMVEIMGICGFDFLILDMEHGPHDFSTLGALIRAAEAGGLLPVVRVRDVSGIGPALDLGAGAVQVPHICSAAQAQQMVRAAKFSPLGSRGVCRYVRAARHSSTDKREYFQAANSALVIAQVEGREGVEQLDAILDVPGIDIIFVGVYDLSQALNRPGEVDHPQVQAVLRDICQRCAARGRTVGTFVESVDTARRLADSGLRYLCYSVDVGLFSDACRQIVAGFQHKAARD